MNYFKKSMCLLLTVVVLLSAFATGGAAWKKAFAADVLTTVPGSTLSVNATKGTVTNILPGMTAATVAGNFVGDVSIYNPSGVKVEGSSVVGTGYTVRLYSGTSLKDSLNIVVYGDITGDGVVSTADLLSLATAIKGTTTLSTYAAYAADINMDGARTASDSISAKRYLGGADVFSSLKGKQYTVVSSMPKYDSVTNAANGVNSTGTINAGTYYVHKSYPAGLNGMYYLTTSSAATGTGFWINPNYNVVGDDSSEDDSSEDDSSEAPVANTYEVVVTINKYSSSANAMNQTYPSGTVAPGTYYIYNAYPNGFNGMYNLTNDPTGAAAGFWINPAENVVISGTPYVLENDTPKYSSSSDAAAGINSTGILPAGTYYIYNKYPDGYNGMLNITTDPTGESVGYWINPNYSSSTAATYVVAQAMPKYSNSADAINRVNSTGTVSAGTYYIYNNYPDGYNGVYCLTNDSTGATPGFWINPKDITDIPAPGPDGTITLVRPVNKYSSSTDAGRQTNITGTAAAGTYYIYKAYPNGLNGAYNVSTDSTGSTAGFWINPTENTTGKLNYNTVKAVWLSQFDLSQVYVSGASQAAKATFTTKIKNTLAAVKNSGYNTILVQVRPNGDAFYNSAYYPWSKYVVGSYGRTASYDPFAIIEEEAHALALSVHAWVNPMRLMSTTEITAISSNNILRQWYNDSTKKDKYIVAVNGNYYLNPGYAETRQLIIDGVTEICLNYDVDGIHFDDYFYPEGVTNSFDAEAFAASGQASRAAWRRLCVSAFVKGTHDAIKAIDEEILFGISPAGNINNNMNYLYADVKSWCASGDYIDYIAPQIYWGFEHAISPFDEILDEWEAIIKTDAVKLCPAITMAKAYGTTDSYDGNEWTNNKDVIKRQITLASSCTNFGGVMLFSLKNFYNPYSGAYYSNLQAERANFEPVLKGLYTTNQW